MGHLCKQCGETNPDSFYNNRKTMCKGCVSQQANQRYHNLSEEDKQAYKDNARTNFKKWTTDNTLQYRYNSARSRAKYKELEFTISLDDVEAQFVAQDGKCYYSGRMMKRCRDGSNAVSIDRIDSTRGYTVDNIVLCTWQVNTMKNGYTVDEFKSIVNDIYKNWEKEND